jgi:ParB family chromosome partitioning protein
MPETRRISTIKVGKRHRRDLGDLQSLADSIEAVGLLHPIVIDSHDRLIAGERRLEAVKLLRWQKVPVRVIDLENIAEGEFHENAARKDFTPSEVAGIAQALRPVIEKRARQRQLDRLRRGREVPVRENFPNGEQGKTVDLIGRYCGLSGRTLKKIEALCQAAEEDPDRFGHLVEEMDSEPRSVHRCYAEVRFTFMKQVTSTQ